MSLKKVAIIFLLVIAALVSGCKKNVQKEENVQKVDEESAVDCSMFVPPWGEEFWEDWGRKNGDRFEAWYTEIIPKMSKVTEAQVKACRHLDNIFLGFSKISSLDVFSDMKHLRKLDLRFSSAINDLSPLKNLENLEFLSIWKTAVIDLTPIVDLPKLKAIDAKMTGISDISMLSKMSSLESIDLLQTKVSDISSYNNLKTLKEVLLCSTAVKDISVVYPIADQITYIDLCNTNFTDFDSLRKFKNLKRLKLWGLPIKDMSLFSGMEDLYELDLWHTEVSDLSPIFNLKNLKKLVIIDLKIKPEQLEQIRKNNPGVEVVEQL